MSDRPTSPHPGPASCPVCDQTVTPEWGNVDRHPTWRYPDHPNPLPDAAGYACVASRWAVTHRAIHRARRHAALDAARAADPTYAAAQRRAGLAPSSHQEAA